MYTHQPSFFEESIILLLGIITSILFIIMYVKLWKMTNKVKNLNENLNEITKIEKLNLLINAAAQKSPSLTPGNIVFDSNKNAMIIYKVDKKYIYHKYHITLECVNVYGEELGAFSEDKVTLSE